MQAAGIITPVSKPINWCLHSVVAPKENGEIRLCTDFRPLNKLVKCEHYQMTSLATAVADIEALQAKIFTTLDALRGYHQCLLDVESQELTTFITPCGRFQFLRAPYCISSISEHYSHQIAEAFEGLPGYKRNVDDIVIYSDADTSHADHVCKFLQRCAEWKISLNPEKFEYGQEQVKFAGLIQLSD